MHSPVTTLYVGSEEPLASLGFTDLGCGGQVGKSWKSSGWRICWYFPSNEILRPNGRVPERIGKVGGVLTDGVVKLGSVLTEEVGKLGGGLTDESAAAAAEEEGVTL